MSFLGNEVKSFLRFEVLRSETQAHYYCVMTKDTMDRSIYCDRSTNKCIVRVRGRCGGKRMVELGDECGC